MPMSSPVSEILALRSISTIPEGTQYIEPGERLALVF
jgi:hypothetical protein